MAWFAVCLNCWMLTFALLAACSEAAIKRWWPDTNFDNPQNWNLGRLPCPSDAIVFPSTAPEVFFPQDFTISSMVLPTNGAMLLAADLTLVFNDKATVPDPPEGCPKGQTIRFNHTLADAWLNPSSWCLPVHDFDADCLVDPLLDTEYVPCTFDDVMFARDTSFFADVNLIQTVAVRTLMIDNMYQTTESFQGYVDTSEGKRRFTGTGLRPLRISIQGLGAACDDPSGCFCGTTDSIHINNVICSYRKCETVPCPYPFIPVGHCCPICGSKMEFTYTIGNDTNAGFDVSQFRKLLTDEYISRKELNYDLVNVILSKLMSGRVQLVLVDPDGGKQAAPMGVALDARIRSDAAFKQRAGVLQVLANAYSSAADPITTGPATTAMRPPATTVDNGGGWSQPNGADQASPADQVGLVVGITCGAVVLLLAALLFVFYRNRRFTEGVAPLDRLAVSINFDDVNEPVTTLRGMNNPTYKATTAAATAASDRSASSRDYVVSVSFTDRETPSAIIDKAAASRDKKKGGSKKPVSVGLQNPLYDSLGAEQQETPIMAPSSNGSYPSSPAAAAAAADAASAAGGRGKGKKPSTVGLSNPLYGLQSGGSLGAAAETVGAASLPSSEANR